MKRVHSWRARYAFLIRQLDCLISERTMCAEPSNVALRESPCERIRQKRELALGSSKGTSVLGFESVGVLIDSETPGAYSTEYLEGKRLAYQAYQAYRLVRD